MAHKKGVGSSDNGRDSHSKRLGVKLSGGSYAIPGNIIVRQRGTKFHPGLNVGMGKDHTLYAREEGFVTFTKKRKNRTYVSIEPTHIVTDEVVTGTIASRNIKSDDIQSGEALTEDQVVEVDNKGNAVEDASTQVSDDLTLIEGVGPKTNEKLHEAGIHTFAQLAAASQVQLNEILENAGRHYAHIDPTTWPQQAQLATDGKMDELKELQDRLMGGRDVESSSEEE